jgi:hypothetical protein
MQRIVLGALSIRRALHSTRRLLNILYLTQYIIDGLKSSFFTHSTDRTSSWMFSLNTPYPTLSALKPFNIIFPTNSTLPNQRPLLSALCSAPSVRRPLFGVLYSPPSAEHPLLDALYARQCIEKAGCIYSRLREQAKGAQRHSTSPM